MIDVRRLRVLSEVAERGSFSAAAEALTLTQSAVSQHIAALEREVGVGLVERGTRPVQLSDAGVALTRAASAIFARLDGAEQELAEIAGRRHGRLRFGTFPAALATLMPSAFAHFRREHPDVHLTVVDDHLQRLITRLDTGELDLALIYEHEALRDISARDLDRTPLLDDAFQAVLPAGHPLARRRRLALSDLAGQPWIGGSLNSAWYRIVTHACREAGFIPDAAFASDDYMAVQALVASGFGVSTIPRLAVMHPLPGVVVRELAKGAFHRQVLAALPRDGYRGATVTTMLESLRAAAQLLM